MSSVGGVRACEVDCLCNEPAEGERNVKTGLSLHTPLFIVGSPRSGTSILTDGMLAAGYRGFREGNFLPLLRVYKAAADRHYTEFGSGSGEVMAARIDWEAFKADIFSVFKRHVDRLNPETPWMDKSGNPEMIEVLPHLLDLWPSAVFVFAKRRGIENVISRSRKFPGHTFEYHCRDWAKNMAAWRAVRDAAGERAIEIDQQEIIRAPEQSARRLADFAKAGVSACGRIREVFTVGRPQETTAGSAAAVCSLEKSSWSQEQRAAFLNICSGEMEAYGYSTEESYWRMESIES